MKYKKRASIATGINLTPLIDIVFLLLVFFMLTAHFVSDEAINVELPNSEFSTKIDENSRVTVVVTKTGEFYMKTQQISKELLAHTISDAIFLTKTKSLYVKGDKEARLKDIIFVMDAAKAAKVEAVSIQSEK